MEKLLRLRDGPPPKADQWPGGSFEDFEETNAKVGSVLSEKRANAVKCIGTYDRTVPFSFKFNDKPEEALNTNDPVAIVQRISETMGLATSRIAVYSAQIETACASTLEDGQRVVYYGRKWLETISGGDYWIKVGILAHEIGHHVNDHKLDGLDFWQKEIEADHFVGRMIFLMNGSLDQAKRAVSRLPNIDSKTHPRRSLRETAVADGFKSGRVTNQAQK